MILRSLRTNQLTPAGMDWYTRYLHAFESLNLETYFAFVAPDAEIHVNDRMPYYGRESVRASLQRYFAAFDRVEHEPLNIYGTDGEFAAEMLTHFTPAGRATATMVPSTSFYIRNASGLLSSLRHQIDATALSA
jgi:hypothetical protein